MIWLNRKQNWLQQAPPGVEPVAQFVSIWENFPGRSRGFCFLRYYDNWDKVGMFRPFEWDLAKFLIDIVAKPGLK